MYREMYEAKHVKKSGVDGFEWQDKIVKLILKGNILISGFALAGTAYNMHIY